MAPEIYEAEVGEEFPLATGEDRRILGSEELRILRELHEDDPLLFEMVRNLVDVEWRFQSKSRRHGLYEELEKVIRRSFYEDEDDAIGRARLAFEAKNGVPHSQNGEE